MPGFLYIKVIRAELTRDTETFGKMDPFCVVKFGGEKYTTQVCNEAGKHPVWNKEFTCAINHDDDIDFEVIDYDEASENDAIGKGRFQIQQLALTGGVFAGNISLHHKHHSAGQLLVEIRSQATAFVLGGMQQQGQFQHQGQFPPQQYPQGQFPPQQYPQGQYPPQQYPQGQFPPQQYPQQNPGQYPPQGQFPPQQYPQGQFPPQQYPQGQFPPQQYPQGQGHGYPQQYGNVKIVFYPHCDDCHGTGVVHKKGKNKPCKDCYKKAGICYKCQGTHWNKEKNKACKCSH